ncbi:hypothetical protein ACFXI8_26515 [Streptomyces niveus]|uniref:hypothetical protein n=1 Tax=Streptomyces niveus TaxID=193462 RepID=UPI0036794065
MRKAELTRAAPASFANSGRRGGGAEPHDTGPRATGVQELNEEFGLADIERNPMFSVDSDGYPDHAFHGRWNGDPATLILNEGTAPAFIAEPDFDPPMRDSKNIDPDTAAVHS